MSGHSYLSLCNCGFSAKRSYYNRYTINRNSKRLQMSRLTHLRRPIIQHNIRHSGAPMNNALHRIANGIINIELQSSTDTGDNNIRNFTTYFKCKLSQKRTTQTLLRQRNYSFKNSIQEIDLRNQTVYQRGNYEEEYEYPKTNLHNLERKMKNLEINSGNVTPEFDPENYSENDENKSEFKEKTEQDLPGNDELNVVYYSNDYEYIIEPTYILDKNEETAVTKTKEKIKIEIIENIIIKPATSKSNEDLLQTSDTDLLKTSNDSPIPEDIETVQTVIARKTNVAKQSDDEQISVRKDEISESSEEMDSRETNNKAKVYKIEPIASTCKETTTPNTANKTKEREIGNLADKSNYTNTEKAPQLEHNFVAKCDYKNVEKATKFDNFKVPKEVTHPKKIIVKKQQPRFILTHVVGGYIIQESNFAFPIRTPQSQRSKPQTSITKKSAPTEIKEDEVDQEESRTEEQVPPTEVKEEKIDQEENRIIEPSSDTEVKDEIVDQEESATVEPVSLTELLIEVKEEETHLKEECVTDKAVPPTEVKQEIDDQGENITIEPVSPIKVKDEETEFNEENTTEEPVPPTEVKAEMKEEVPNEESNPFARLLQSTVRSWTVEDLSNHLQKFNWEETAVLLEDNEIDGAALFMVIKSQLMIIGINEEQAEVICEFVQSGSSRGN